MPGADQALGVPGQVDDRQEIRREFSAPLFHREVFLVVAHHRDQDLVRQVKERRVEPALNDVGKFVQVADLLQKIDILVNFVACCAWHGRPVHG